MADPADMAENDIPVADATEICKMFIGESLEFCENCGDDIPEVRRRLGNVKLCVHCKQDEENKSSRRN